MKQFALALCFFASPALASMTTDGVILPIKQGCIYFFPAGFSSPYNITISDASTGSVLFTLASGVVETSDTCVPPTGHPMTWMAN